MRRIASLVPLVALTLLLALPVLTAAQGDVEARFDRMVPVEPPYEAHQLVLDFVPGTVAPLHQHGGPGYITMLQGELTLQTDGDEQVYAEGDSFIEVPESLYEGWNATDELASLVVTYIVPEGHDVTTYVPSDSGRTGPAPQPVTQSVFPVDEPLDDYQVIHRMIDLEPEEWVSVHDDAGRTFVTVVSGELTIEAEDGSQRALGAGESLSNGEGPGHRLGNAGTEPVTVAATLLIPESDSAWNRSTQIGVLVAAAGIGLAGGAFMLRRRERQSA